MQLTCAEIFQLEARPETADSELWKMDVAVDVDRVA